MTPSLPALFASLCFLGSSLCPAQTANWPQWRGPNQDDHSPDTGLLKSWPAGGPQQLWVYENAGLGYSGFSVVNGVLYTMGTRGENLLVLAVDIESGEEKWSTKIGIDDADGYNAGWGNGPRGTPTVANGKVYALGPKGTLACLDAGDGNTEWSKNLAKDFDGKAGGWGFAESPLVDAGKVIVGPGGKKTGIIALDANTGKTIWASKEVTPGKAEYASPLKANIHGKDQYIRFFEKEVASVDANDGKLLWKAEWPRGSVAVIPTPIVDGNRLYISSGYKAGSKLFEIQADGKVDVVWDDEEGVMVNHHGGVILHDGHLFGFSDGRQNKGLVCQKLETGELVWNEGGKTLTKGAVHYADGMLYCLNEGDGTVTLVKASTSGFEKSGEFKLSPQSEQRHIKGKIWTHPVVIGGKLFLRDQELLHCYDVSG